MSLVLDGPLGQVDGNKMKSNLIIRINLVLIDN